jgi:hypothetical protein
MMAQSRSTSVLNPLSQIIEDAAKHAKLLNQDYVTETSLFLALLDLADVQELFSKIHVDYLALRKDVLSAIGKAE